MLRTALWDSCVDVFRAVCCGAFRDSGNNGGGGGGNNGGEAGANKQQPQGATRKRKPSELGAKPHLDVMENIRSKFESFTHNANTTNTTMMGLGGGGNASNDYRLDSDSSSPSQTCTTITRPGYILQVPTVTSMDRSPVRNTTNITQSMNETYSKSHKMFSNDLTMVAAAPPPTCESNRNQREKKKKKSSANANGGCGGGFNRPPPPPPSQMDVYGLDSDRGGGGSKDCGSESTNTNNNPNDLNNASQTEDELNRTGNTSACIDKIEFRRSTLEAYENEIFYHVPNKLIGSPQVSSAF